jgi:hypothetical protein
MNRLSNVSSSLWGGLVVVALVGCSSHHAGAPAGGAGDTGEAGAGGEGAGGTGGSSPSPPPRDSSAGPTGGSGPAGDDAGALASDGSPLAMDGGGIVPPPPPPTSDTLPPCKRTVDVADSAKLMASLGAAQAGDCIVLADGTYTFPVITAKGAEAAPIVVRAANTLKSQLTTGNLELQGAAYVVVQGLLWTGPGTVKMTDCDHCRLSRCRIQRQETGGGEWTMITGTSKYCRIDHNDFGPQNQVGNMIQLGGAGAQIVQYSRIDHNFFHDVHFSGANGWESIRAGLSGWTFSSSHTVIEQNLFMRDNNDPEIISVKSSDNTVRHNTVRASNGHISQRHGNRNQYYGNYVLGDGVGGSAGIRVFGGNHLVFNNYVQGVSSFGILLEGGENDDTHGALTDHKEVYNATVVFNTIVSSKGLVLGGSHPLGPINTTVAYNIVQGSLEEMGGSMGTKYLGNIVNGGPVAVPGAGAGVKMIDPKLTKMGEIFRIGPSSPAVDAAMNMFSFVSDDGDGRPRMGVPDIGAQEVTNAPALYGLLSEADVGPVAP